MIDSLDKELFIVSVTYICVCTIDRVSFYKFCFEPKQDKNETDLTLLFCLVSSYRCNYLLYIIFKRKYENALCT